MTGDLARLLSALQRTQLLDGLAAEEVADALWLACRVPGGPIDETPPPTPIEPTLPDPIAPVDDESLPTAPRQPPVARPELAPERRPATEAVRRPAPPDPQAPTTGNFFDLRSDSGPPIAAHVALARSLRRSLPRVAVVDEAHMDEVLTAERIAEDRSAEPVPLRLWRRKLEVALVVDTHVSMLPWRSIAADLVQVLRRSGSFRDVRVWSLDLQGEPGVRAGLGPDQHTRLRQSPRIIADPTGRRLVLFLSDCVGPGWADGSVVAILDAWARGAPVALVQPLPAPLWRRTPLGEAQGLQLRPGRPFAGNTGYSRQFDPPPQHDDTPSIEASAIPYPVVELEPGAVGRFACLLGGTGSASVPGVTWSRAALTTPGLEGPPAALSPAERVRQFRRLVSPTARKLTGLLAATAPLTPTSIRLVRQHMLPRSSLVHEAEVLLGGILQVIPGDATTSEPTFEFAGDNAKERGDLRDLLLNNVASSDMLAVLRVVAETMPATDGAETLRVVLQQPPNSPIKLRPGASPLHSTAARVLLRLGGSYAQWVDDASPPPPGLPGPGAAPEPGDDTDRTTTIELGDTTERMITAGSTDETVPTRRSRRRRAVVVGVSTYARYSPVENAAADAQRLYRTLTEIGGFAEDDITLLLDEGATAEHIHRALGKLVDDESTASFTLVYFAGHAADRDGATPEHLLLPHDAPLRLDRGSAVVSLESIETLLFSLHPRTRTLLIADTTSATGIPDLPRGQAWITTLTGRPAPSAVALLGHRAISTSASGTAEAPSFTQRLLRGLGGEAPLDSGGYVTLAGLVRYITDARGMSRTPVFQNFGVELELRLARPNAADVKPARVDTAHASLLLRDLLIHLFTDDEFRRFLRYEFAGGEPEARLTLSAEIPGPGTPRKELVAATLRLLAQYDVLGVPFFESLRRKRPGRRRDIENVQAAFGLPVSPEDTHPVEPTGPAALYQLFCSIFRSDELSPFMVANFGDNIREVLPNDAAPIAPLADAAVTALAQHGYLDRRLFDLLAQVHPSHGAKIDAVAARFGLKPARREGPAPGVLRILMISASPNDDLRLRTAREMQDLILRFRSSRLRDRLHFTQSQAARFEDLRTALLENLPHIVHFSGHVDDDGSVVFQGDGHGPSRTVTQSTLQLAFLAMTDLRLLVLESPNSAALPAALTRSVDWVIALPGPERTRHTDFADGFYEALAFGKSVERAFDIACTGIDETDDPPRLFPVDRSAPELQRPLIAPRAKS